jgi:plasmid stabilization system protein ParE
MEVRYSEEADHDIDEAWSTLETSRPGEGERFHAEVRATMAYIELWPRGFQIRYSHYRFVPLAIFRYHIIYSIEGEFIVVHRIRHMHQKPLKRYFGPRA